METGASSNSSVPTSPSTPLFNMETGASSNSSVPTSPSTSLSDMERGASNKIDNLQNEQSLEQTSDKIDEVNLRKKMYQEAKAQKATSEELNKLFREYRKAKPHVKEFYKNQHTIHTYQHNIELRERNTRRPKTWMTVVEAIYKLDTLVDQSDPDTEVGQMEHFLQTAEAVRRDGHSRAMQFTGLIHDLGKMLSEFGHPQVEIVGDTFPVGCAFEDTIVLPETFEENPDCHDPRYKSKYGIYTPNCGLDNVIMSYGHDEYLYDIAKEHSKLPQDCLDMIRFHSFYPWHTEKGYRHLMNEKDQAKLEAVNKFNPYDLYSKLDESPKVEDLMPYYEELIAEFMPGKIPW